MFLINNYDKRKIIQQPLNKAALKMKYKVRGEYGRIRIRTQPKFGGTPFFKLK